MHMIWAAAGLMLTPSAQDAPLAWLVGHWCTVPAKGETVCETWERMGGDGIMQGESETHRGDKVSTERMWILTHVGRLVFRAAPQGQAETEFVATTLDTSPRDLTFENRAHDYPQRVRYWREGEMLMAEISLADGGKPMRWRYRRVR